MPPAASAQRRYKHQIPKQDPSIAKRLKHNQHAKLLKQVEKLLFDFEQGQDSPVLVKAEADKNKALREEVGQLKRELDLARDDIQILKGNNNSLTADLLKKKPRSQLSDTHIAEMYQQLRERISSWIDNEITMFEDAWRDSHNGAYPEFSPFENGNIPEHAAFLASNYRLGGEHLVQSVVQAKLQEFLFSNDMIFFALEPCEARFLHKVEEGLSRLDPPRDSSMISYLRSEILKGFTASPEFHSTVTELKSEFGHAIFDAVSIILPQPWDKIERRLRFDRCVLEPAANLAVYMKTSATDYVFTMRMTRESQFAKVPLVPGELTNCIMIDIDTRQVVKPRRMAGANDGDAVLQQVLLLSPGLLRRAPGEADKCLAPSVICVKLDQPDAGDVYVSSISDIADRSSSAHCASDRETPEAIASMENIMKDMNAQDSSMYFNNTVKAKDEEPAKAPNRQLQEPKPSVVDLGEVEEKKHVHQHHVTNFEKANAATVAHGKTDQDHEESLTGSEPGKNRDS